jgi:uncharacterized membrane protein YdfJ with MMPL/SSD domain
MVWERLTRWVLRHNAIVVAAWAVRAIAAFVTLPSLSGHLDTTVTRPVREGDEVFILSRMREECDQTGSTEHALVTGLGRTGRLVTSAAPIAFLAFSCLASAPAVSITIFATGLAAGIRLDATVVRMLLVPSLIMLFGRWNWWLLKRPARVLRVEPALSAGAEPAADES